MPADAHVAINTIILYVPLPAVALLTIPHLVWDAGLLVLCLIPWVMFFAAYLFFPFLGNRWGWDKGVIGCLILTAGLGNTSFVGFPVIEALYGKEALKHAILMDQPGTFLIVSSLGIYVAALYSTGAMLKRELFRKVFLFPPFLAFLLAIILSQFGWKATGDVQVILEKLAAVLTPLALISVGLQLRWSEMRSEAKFLGVGLFFKLILCPLGVFLLVRFLNLRPELVQVAVLESAMGPMITASIIASAHQLRPRLAGMMVGVGVPLSFISLLGWYLLLQS